ncbi:rhodanese-like domain-containing protein [Xylophilus sp. GOD-11R]|uniref:oxygen-dependent tRNA uridine(34) hydroxylase TrhO n=1 Tax=Xylophilus sp. GOD-11R TaxID=3089814 RepID=UPI00298BDC39|nr:rhodanese-like domain-containing protein [Xylophilus sp. GOD-11R]WPB55762.1 rhodanese-like domain-containing protein [Xylophilus sp. GOD-11R]
MTSPNTAGLQHSSFYRFVPIAAPEAAADAVRVLAQGLRGAVVLAAEGISGTVAGEAGAVDAFEAALQSDALLDGALRDMVFKRSGCAQQPFGRLKVGTKPEIVALGLPGQERLPAPDEHDASHLSPVAWRELIARPDVVLLDNRNHFEYRLGHFQGAVDPRVHNFRDFVAYVQERAPTWRAEGRPVAMYCTGGIRCDKTAPWMRSLGLEVYQLEGGILNYFQRLPDADRDWLGECFVFDRRIALDTRLHETATGAAKVFDADLPDEAWRLQRALRLDPQDET